MSKTHSFINSFIWLHVSWLRNHPHCSSEKKNRMPVFVWILFLFFCFQVDNSFGGDNKSFCSLCCDQLCVCVRVAAFQNMQSATHKANRRLLFYCRLNYRVSSHTLPGISIEIRVPATQFRLFVSFFVHVLLCCSRAAMKTELSTH